MLKKSLGTISALYFALRKTQKDPKNARKMVLLPVCGQVKPGSAVRSKASRMPQQKSSSADASRDASSATIGLR